MTSLVISNVSERSHNRITWREILRGYTPQNDNCLLLLSRRKEVTKKGRPLVIGFSCLPLHSPTGAAELAALRQSSPAFRLLPRFRQPDKGGHFPTPTWHCSVSCITEKEILRCSASRNDNVPTLPAIKVRAVSTCHSERMRGISYSLLVEILHFTTVSFRMTVKCHFEHIEKHSYPPRPAWSIGCRPA